MVNHNAKTTYGTIFSNIYLFIASLILPLFIATNVLALNNEHDPIPTQSNTNNIITHNELSIELISSGNPSNATINAQNTTTPFLFALDFKLVDGWKIYGRDPGEVGLRTDILVAENAKNIKKIDIKWPKDKVFFESGFKSFGYDDDVLIPIVIEPENINQDVTLDLDISYGICKDICIPHHDTLSLNIPYSYFNQDIYDKINNVITSIDSPTTNLSSTHTTSNQQSTSTDTKKSSPNDIHDITITKIIIMLIAAFLGGLILNIMPCVLPVLSIKILSILKAGGDNIKTSRTTLLTVASGIIFSFLFLASITSLLKFYGKTIGWGIHFQEPLFIIFLIILLLFFAASLFDFIMFKLPNWLNNKINKSTMVKKEVSFIENFLTGALATLLATPCSAPLVGTATAFALSNHYIFIFLIFAMMGIGMSLPYLLIAMSPNIINLLPKPGSWMIKFKKFLGMLLLLTILWLLYVLMDQLSIAAATIIGIITAFILKLLQIQNSNPRKLIKQTFIVMIIILTSLTFIIPLKFKQMSHHIEKMNESTWITFDQDKIPTFVADDKIVFIDVTANWCITCKFNKITVLNRMKVLNRLSKDDVIAMRADYTNRNQKIAEFLASFNRYGIPFYVIYSKKYPDGLILPNIITTNVILEYIDKAAY